MKRSIDRACDCFKREPISIVVEDGTKSVPCPVDGCKEKIVLIRKKKAKKKPVETTEEG